MDFPFKKDYTSDRLKNPSVHDKGNTMTESHRPITMPSQRQLAHRDLCLGLKQIHLWFFLAYQDIRLRYRRSVLGPFWLTLSMAITVYTMGFLYAHLFHVDMQVYYPHLVSGMVAWSFISSVISDATDTYLLSEGLLRQIKLPYSLYIHRMITRNLIIFFHNLIVMIPVLLLFHEKAKVNIQTLLLVPNLILVYACAFFMGNIIAMIGARYRDISQMIKSLIQVIFFVTPVMWMVEALPQTYAPFIYLNPVYDILELIRAPLLGQMPNVFCYLGTLICIAFSFFAHQFLFIRYRARIIYWI